MLRFLIGLIGGMVATGPMTAAMIWMHRRLPGDERYALPPREITMKLAREAGVENKMDRQTRAAVTLLSHFGYGAGCGGLYALAAPEIPAPALAKGTVFGLIVWTVSYVGLMPGLGILRPATEHPARRSGLMIAAHVVWGMALGLLVKILTDETEDFSEKPLSGTAAPHKDVADG